jgi:hypothetical protein
VHAAELPCCPCLRVGGDMSTILRLAADRRSVDDSSPVILNQTSKKSLSYGTDTKTLVHPRSKSPDSTLVDLEAHMTTAASVWKASIGWGVRDSSRLYNMQGWGGTYFSAGENGNLFVTPQGYPRRNRLVIEVEGGSLVRCWRKPSGPSFE